jgi:hypothetical protein
LLWILKYQEKNFKIKIPQCQTKATITNKQQFALKFKPSIQKVRIETAKSKIVALKKAMVVDVSENIPEDLV